MRVACRFAPTQKRDLVALSPTGSGKTLSYLLPLLTLLRQPASASDEGKASAKGGPRALILSPTRELALQIANESAKLTQGRKWRVVVLSKANENSVVDGTGSWHRLWSRKRHTTRADLALLPDILISTPLRLVQTLKNTNLSLAK